MKLFKILFLGLIFFNGYLFAQNNFINHKIEKGETLTQICNQYEVNLQEVLKLNPDAAAGLKEGAYLIIPKLAAVKKSETPQTKTNDITHEVVAKETLFGISKKYNVSIDELVKTNPFLNEGLKDGQKIVIPSKAVSSIDKPSIPTEIKNTVFKDNQNVQDYHIVKAGETKFSLAKQYGLTVAELEELNPEIKNVLPVDFELKVNKNATKKAPSASVKETTGKETEKAKTEKLELGKNQIVAQKGMTLYKIATENNVSVDELLAANPSLKDGLKENDVITIPPTKKSIPKQENKNKSFVNTAAKRIAILLPFNQIERSKIELQLGKDKFLNMVTDFYLGNKIAIDSAKVKKMKHHVEFFDSNETASSSNVEDLVKTGKLNNFDVIIGCFYPNNTDKLVDLMKDKPTIIVSPLRHQDNSYPTLVETMVKKEVLYDEVIKYFLKSNSNLISIIDIKKVFSHSFFSNQSAISNFKWTEKDNFKPEELMDALQKDKTNVIFFDSESLGFLIKINQLATALKTDGFQIKLVSIENHALLESDEVFLDFVNNELIYLSTFDNRDTKLTKIFDKNYRSKYKSMPNQFVFRGYDVAMDVFERAAQSEPFINTFKNSSDQLNTKFSYVKTPENGYKNLGFFLFQYQKNNTIKQLNE